MRFAFGFFGLLTAGTLVSCSGVGFGLEAGAIEGVSYPPISSSVEGQTFLVEFADVQHTVPTGLSNMWSLLGGKGLLLHVVAEEDAHLEVVLSLSDEEGDQSPCEPVHKLPSPDWTNPVFHTPPVSTQLSVGGEPVSIDAFEIEGMFASEGDYVEDLRLTGVFDIRGLATDAVGDGEACAFVEQLNGECMTCADGQDACVLMELNVAYAERVGISFDPSLDTSGC